MTRFLLTCCLAFPCAPLAAAMAPQGAEHWAFVVPRSPELPVVDDLRFGRQPIDRLVASALRERGIEPRPRADRRTLIRRVTFDLTGLPPTLDEVHSFVADDAADAYERLVDGLLARPQYGEHMARAWLDIVRFADTNGIHHDHYREMSLYRDWVIRAFNENLPYDTFAVDQIAGDLHSEPTDEQLVASGFNRLHLIIDRGTMLPEESYTRNVVDRVTAFGTAFLGLTVQCAVCHDHKYDPIRQRDFFQLFAFFNNLDADPETGPRQGTDFLRGLQPPYVELPSPEQAAALAAAEAMVTAASEEVAVAKQREAAAGDDPARGEFVAQCAAAEGRLQRRQQELDAVKLSIPAAMVMRERAEPRPAHILIRGAYDRLGAVVERATPAFLPPLPETDGPPSRMDLARWLTTNDHPLTARVAVNRIWQQIFGTGIVKTAEDFGTQGSRPSHPALLEHLATSFMDSGWDVKALVRRIVLSETYCQASSAPPEVFRQDPENRRLARGPRFRLDAEMIRDAMLASSGLLNPELYGKSVKPPQPPGLWEAVALPDSYPRVHTADPGRAVYRRSLYTFWKRGLPPPQMTLFDAPTRESCVARRERTNTPLQALVLMNEQQCVEAARHLAWMVICDGPGATDVDLATRIYETVTAQLPDAAEIGELIELVGALQEHYAEQPDLATALCAGVELGDLSAPRLAAWTLLASTVYNLDIAKTKG